MGIKLLMSQDNSFLIEEGEYTAELERIDIKEGRYLDKDGNPIPVLNFVFKVVDGTCKGREVVGLASAVLSPGNKLDAWLRALGADTVNIGEALDTDSVIGRRARIYIEHKEVPKNGQMVKKHYISKVKPAKTPEKQEAPAQQIPAQAPVLQTPVHKAPPKATESKPATPSSQVPVAPTKKPNELISEEDITW